MKSMRLNSAPTKSWMNQPSVVGQTILIAILVLLGITMIFPFLYVIAVSFSSYADVARQNLIFLPLHPTIQAYRWLLDGGTVLQALQVSVFLTCASTAFSITMTTIMAYGLSRRDVPGMKFFLWVVLLSMLVGPTFIATYLVIKQLGMIDTYWALIIPNAISAFNVIVMRQFFLAVPSELTDCARVDGAHPLQILWYVILPLSKAVVAVITLFTAIGVWNSFFGATIYISDASKYPLPVVLRLMVLEGQRPIDDTIFGAQPPPDITIQMAIIVLSTVPILLIYPFLQKYFTKGVLTGAIKG